MQTSGSVRNGLASYLIIAVASLAVLNCAHQDDDAFIVRRSKEMVPPPAVPPRGPLPVPAPSSASGSLPPSASSGSTPSGAPSSSSPSPATGSTVSVPKPRSDSAATDANDGKNKSRSKNTAAVGKANLASFQLKLDTSLSPPVKRLVNNAEESLKKGRVLEARAQADRAYRMDLRDPRTSFLLAKVSIVEKDYDSAEQWAMRALEYVNDDANKSVIWSLVARAREKAGNKIGVTEALKKRSSAGR
jgi:hypothetical protein